MTQQRFQYLDEVPTPEGAEGWERMYPYYLVSSEVTRQRDRDNFWFAETLHYSKVQYPFDSIVVEAIWLGLSQYASRVFAFPFSMGMDARIVNGYTYMASIPITDPQEVQRRVLLFQERTQYYYQNWDKLYASWREKIQAVIDEMQALEFPLLEEFDVDEIVNEARGRSSGYDLVTHYRRLVDLFMLVHQYHFEMLNIGYAAYGIFFQFCKEEFQNLHPVETLDTASAAAFSVPDEFSSLAGASTAAIVIATPDDVGTSVLDGQGNPRSPSEIAKFTPRARENVWIEMGWLWAHLGRGRILLMVKEGTEVPSDIKDSRFKSYKDDPTELAREMSTFITSLNSAMLSNQS